MFLQQEFKVQILQKELLKQGFKFYPLFPNFNHQFSKIPRQTALISPTSQSRAHEGLRIQ